jgi:type II secretory pathway pseudopilin PulG
VSLDIALIVVVVVVVALAGIAFLVVASRRRHVARARRRHEVLTEVAARIDRAVASLGELTLIASDDSVEAVPPSPDPAPVVEDDLAGRARLLQELALDIAGAQSQGDRLAAAVVRSEDGDAATLARDARSVADVRVYTVGPRAVALVLPGLGRADALGVLARIETRGPSSGWAAALESGEDAVELAARLLGSGTAGA